MLVNTILWGDVPNEMSGDGSPTVTYSDIQGGYAGEGNIDVEPLWVDPDNGDFHLSGDSPCIDAGTNDAPYLPEYDFEGDPRIIDGDGDGTAIVDMGIDEFVLLGWMHVGGIEGFFSFDYLGRPRLRMHVLVEDEGLNPLPDVLVEAAIWVPDGGPFVRERYTKLTGNARFHWGSNASGTWTLCVEHLARAGYVHNPDDNVVTCMDWAY